MIFKKHKHSKRPSTVDRFNQPKEYHEGNKVFTVAFVLDGVVEEIVRTEERFMSILTSDPTIVDITENELSPQLGWEYNYETGEFFKNEEVQEEDIISSNS